MSLKRDVDPFKVWGKRNNNDIYEQVKADESLWADVETARRGNMLSHIIPLHKAAKVIGIPDETLMVLVQCKEIGYRKYNDEISFSRKEIEDYMRDEKEEQ